METGGGRKRSCGDQRLGWINLRMVGYRRHALMSLNEKRLAMRVKRMKATVDAGVGAGRSFRVAEVRLPCAPIALLAERIGACVPLESLHAILQGKMPRKRRTDTKIQ
jgi:hypothetical protein